MESAALQPPYKDFLVAKSRQKKRGSSDKSYKLFGDAEREQGRSAAIYLEMHLDRARRRRSTRCELLAQVLPNLFSKSISLEVPIDAPELVQ
jgi:hypothetical protein